MNDYLPDLLSLWHEHRVAVILLAAIGVAVVRLILHYRSPTQVPQTARQSSPTRIEKDAKPKIDALPLNEESEKSQLRDADHLVGVIPKKAARPSVKTGPKRVSGVNRTKLSKSVAKVAIPEAQIQPLVFYFSLAGATESAAIKLGEHLKATEGSNQWLDPAVHNLTEIDYDDFFINPPKSQDSTTPVQYFYVLLIPSYNIDSELSNFLEHLSETHNDFRIDTAPLQTLAGYSVFGFGDKEGWPTEEDGYCSQAIEVDKWMARLTGKRRAYPLGMGDVKGNANEALREWQDGVKDVMAEIAQGNGLGEGVQGSGDAVESDEEAEDDASEGDDGEEAVERQPKRTKASKTQDLEDIRGPGEADSDEPIDFTTYGKPSKQSTLSAPKEMVPKTSPTYTALTKQGYTIVGSHSGVKICRWTKSALRGRGSCYKFSFYGIKSHLCMETTPALSCSNKCVFCWRHGTNPVGTTWRWQVDPPEMIFAGVKEGHYKKIKMMKGVPGVRAERFAEAMRIRHCALSLVGEPIFYPHINEFTAMLHAERISSFLVCNAQHPDQLAALKPVTQLYVSIDASNKDALRKIDRPLHRDFWERFCRCMDILREKRFRQRTVFRLTLVKGFNIDEEAEGYAALVERALPGFVEVKGVTYCGTSTSASAGLTMQNVPFYEEVCAFVEALVKALNKRGLDYGIAAEHAHSCCILIADQKRFHKEDGWHTIIDYEKFFECLESGREFGPEDYIGPATPEWALWGNGGFDPRDDRVDRKGKKKEGVVTVGGGRVIEL
ncbi:hypothetical protein MBLNU457_1295t1 [Dothideomycetes sp. NU457]